MRRLRAIRLLLPFALASFDYAAIDARPSDTVISGTVRLVGTAPSIPVIVPPVDSDTCGDEPRPTQSLILGSNQTIRDTIIYLDGYPVNPAPGMSPPPVVLDQRHCEFIPRIQIGHSGAPLVIKNSDPILHVVRIDSMSSTNGQHMLLQMATPYARFEKVYQLANSREPVLLHATGNNGHEWMSAYIAVLPHAWAALTDANGRFTLHDIPPGTHKLYAWHEVLGTLTRDVKIEPNRTATVDFEFTGGK